MVKYTRTAHGWLNLFVIHCYLDRARSPMETSHLFLPCTCLTGSCDTCSSQLLPLCLTRSLRDTQSSSDHPLQNRYPDHTLCTRVQYL